MPTQNFETTSAQIIEKINKKTTCIFTSNLKMRVVFFWTFYKIFFNRENCRNLRREDMIYNKVMLAGNICNDLALQHTKATNKPVLSLIVALQNKGEKNKSKKFIKVVLWDHLAEFVASRFEKGQNIFVEGHLQSNTYEQDGKLRAAIEVVANSVEFVNRQVK